MTYQPLLHLLPLSEYRDTTTATISPASLRDEGFVHCSPDVPTTLAVANSLYRDAEEPVVALELDPGRLSSPIRWEAPAPAPPEGVSNEVLFPHVYGPLERSAVVSVRYARRDVAGNYLDLQVREWTAEALDLLPHPEGGWFRRTWASGVEVTPPGGSTTRPTATSIHFLLTPGERSAWHTVASDELWFWHRGGPVRLSLGGDGPRPARSPRVVRLGPDLVAGEAPQAVVPAGTWQMAEAEPGSESLVSCVVSPGFDFADFRTL